MGLILAIILTAGGAIGLGRHEGVFKKGADTTRRDTYAFEKQALESHLARNETHHRSVFLLEKGTTQQNEAHLAYDATQNRLKSKIARIETIEEYSGWDD